MKKNIKGLGLAALTLLVAVALLPSTLLAAKGADQADMRVLIDISGSMKENDPQNLRRSALRLLVGLLPPGTRAGVWTFGQYVNMQIKLGVIDAAWKKRARAEAGKIHSRGLYTNIEEVLKRSTEDWEGQPRLYRRSVILLTDGMVDISKDSAKDRASRDRIIKEIVPRLKTLGVTVHTMALSERADQELMRQLSETTGGWYEQVNSADRLQRVFLKLFEKVGKPDTVPLKDNRFTIDKSISEATLLVFRREGSEPSRVMPPKGRSFDADSVPANIQWHRDSGYDLLTIKNPQPGEWRIQADMDPDNRVMIVTDLKMKTTTLPSRLLVGEQLPVEISFTEQGRVITKKEFLSVVDVSAERWGKEGLSEPRPVYDDGKGSDKSEGDGLFTLNFGEELDEGAGELIINAKGSTFVREQRQVYEILQPGFLEVMPAMDGGEAAVARVTLAEGLMEPDSISFDAVLEGDDESIDVTLEQTEEWFFSSEIDLSGFRGERQLIVKLSAKSMDGRTIAHAFPAIEVRGTASEPEPEPALEPVEPEPVVEKQADAKPAPVAEKSEPEPEKEERGMMQPLILFGIGNLVLILLGGGGYWFMRRRGKSGPSLDDDDDEENEDEKGKKDKKGKKK